MQSVVMYFNRYPIWANVLMWVILILGFLSLKNINSSFFPQNPSSLIIVDMAYPGTSPVEIEEVLVKKVEENLVGLEGVDWTTSFSTENRGTIRIYVSESYHAEDVLVDVQNAVDRITPYPSGAEQPQVYVTASRDRSLELGIMGQGDLWALKNRAERFEEILRSKPGVTQISFEGVPQREIAIEVDMLSLKAHGLTMDQLAESVRSSNKDLSGGVVKTPSEELLIRAYQKKRLAWQIQNIIIKSSSEGGGVLLRDVAKVVERWADVPSKTTFNGEPAILVKVEKTQSEDILHVKDMTVEAIAEFESLYPEVETKILIDATDHLQGRIDLLTKNGLIGFILVVLVLSLFLNWRIAFWVALGIPISFAGMFIIANIVGITINVLSLFGMIVVIGILVDDAIVVAEQIYQEKEKGATSFEAATQGLKQIIAPVTTAVITTVLAFLPFFFLEGNLGKMVWQMALVVVGALFFSLVESFLILPAHLSHSKGLNNQDQDHLIRKKLESFYQVVAQFYGRSVGVSLKYRYITLLIPVSCLFITAMMVKTKTIEFNPFPKMDRESVAVSLSMVPGTPENQTLAIMQQIEAGVWELNPEFKEDVVVGDSMIVATKLTLGSNRDGEAGTHAADLKISFAKAEHRKIPSMQIIRKLRSLFKDYPGVENLNFVAGHWGRPISFGLVSEDLSALMRAKDSLVSRLEAYPGLKDIGDSEVKGRREIQIQLKKLAYAYGLTAGEISRQVRQAWFGSELQRLQRGSDEIQLWLRLQESDRASMRHLDQFVINTPKGQQVPLHRLANYKIGRGPATIEHVDGARQLGVSADFSDPNTSSTTMMQRLNNEVVPDIQEAFPSVTIGGEGQSRQNAKMVSSVGKTFPPALFGILVVLVLVFRSYLQSGLIFLMIPLGIIGAFWGHLVHGQMVTQLSAFGIIALTGVVINDSIVFIDQINIYIRQGKTVHQSIVDAGVNRFRPIVLTTLTTVSGLWPLIMESSFQAQFLIPMAISMAYGLLLGSVFILYLVPTFFAVLNDLRTQWHIMVIELKYKFKVGDYNSPYLNVMGQFDPSDVEMEQLRREVEPSYQETISIEKEHESALEDSLTPPRNYGRSDDA